MKRNKLVTVAAICCLPVLSLAQKGTGYQTMDAKPLNQTSHTSQNQNPKEGTYQFRVYKEDYMPLVSKDILASIDEKRKQNESVVIKLDEYTELFIPSINEINSTEFQNLEPIKFIKK